MAGHKSIAEALKAGDVNFVNMTREQARKVEGLEGLGGADIEGDFVEALDAAQGGADTEGLSTFVVIEIVGAAL